jgi:hypothetical protein
MRYLRRATQIVWFSLMIAAGSYLGPVIASQLRQETQPRPLSKPTGSRMGMRLATDNAGGPGKLVVSGLLVVGMPQKVPTKAHRMVLKLRILAEDGTAVVEKEIDRFTVDPKAHHVEYPVRRVYHLPAGTYQVQLQGWDLNRPIKDETGEFVPIVHANTWHAVP